MINENIHILVVEDNPGDAQLIPEYLHNSSLASSNLVFTDSLEKTLETINSSEFDVILLDLNLPDSNGLETLKEILNTNCSAAIVVLTGMNNDVMGDEAIQLGAQDYLVKNALNTDNLPRTLKYAISRNNDQKKLEHISKVLQATRNINQLITKVEDEEVLIKTSCEILVDQKGYNSAWILLMDSDNKVRRYAERGHEDKIGEFIEIINNQNYPRCISKAMKSDRYVYNHISNDKCQNCPIAKSYRGNTAFVTQLTHKGTLFGFMGISIDTRFAFNQEEINLFNEVTGDIAYSLYSIGQNVEKEQLDRNFRIEQKKLSNLISNIPGIAFRCKFDSSWTMEYLSKACYDILEYTPEEIINNNLISYEEVIHPGDRPRVREEILNSVSSANNYSIEYRINTKGNATKWVWEIGTLERNNGQITHLDGYITDITEKKITEGKLQKRNAEILNQIHEYQALNEEYLALNEDLHKANEQLQETNIQLIKAKEIAEQNEQLKGAFMANMSHEIRTPMNAIIGFSNLLESEELSHEKRKYFIELIKNAGERLLKIINDVIDISKIEVNQLSISYSSCNICDVFKTSYEFFKQSDLLKNKPEVELRPAIVENLKNCRIQTDNARLGQILDNLISNAIKYTNKGFIEFGFEISEDGRWITFFVKDTGIGVPKEKRELIFERFRQIEELEFHEGAGLGLSITRGIVKLMGGEIWLESEYGKGSTFYFRIPYIPMAKTEIKKESSEISSLDLLNKKIIIAEDNYQSYEYLKELLNGTEAKISHVQNGQELMELLNISIPDIILLDINMPVKSGFKCLEEIKQKYNTRQFKIIAQTAYALSEEREKCLEFGCDEYLAKPFSKSELFSKIKSVINN